MTKIRDKNRLGKTGEHSFEFRQEREVQAKGLPTFRKKKMSRRTCLEIMPAPKNWEETEAFAAYSRNGS